VAVVPTDADTRRILPKIVAEYVGDYRPDDGFGEVTSERL